MATGGPPFDDSAEELHNWTVTNGSLEDRLNNTVRAGPKLHWIYSTYCYHWRGSSHVLPLLYNCFHDSFFIQSVCPHYHSLLWSQMLYPMLLFQLKLRYITSKCCHVFVVLIRTGVCSRRKQTDLQRRTRRSCQLWWWRAVLLMIFLQSQLLGLVAGEHALLIPFLTSNTLPRCLSQTRLSWTSCGRESISQT